jgi:hypothetical protein
MRNRLAFKASDVVMIECSCYQILGLDFYN